MKKYRFLAQNTIEKVVQIRVGTSFNAGFSQQSRLWEKMSYKLDGSDVQYRMHLFRNLKHELRDVFENQKGVNAYKNAFEEYSRKLSAAEKNVIPFNRGMTYRCLKCNNQLFNEINVFENETKAWLLCQYIYIDP